MHARQAEFLHRLLDAPGPSGYESVPSRIWREEAATFATSVDHDVLGNSYARIGTPGKPVVLIEGHIDEIGLLITHIDPEGFLWFDHIGGWDNQVLVGQRVTIASSNGPVPGVIGRKAAHLLTAEDRTKVVQTRDMWIDIGAKDRAAAQAKVEVGDPVVIDARMIEFDEDLVVSRSLDNRVGAFVALEALRLLAEDTPALDLYAVAATQEEITFAGAMTSSFKLAPTVAVAIDVTHATDYPGADKKKDDEVRLGGGPVLARGASLNPVAFRRIEAVSRNLGMDLPVQASPRYSGTDADAMIKSGVGTATVLVSIPNRYMHSPNEMVSRSDLVNAAKLIAEFVRTIDEETDFRP